MCISFIDVKKKINLNRGNIKVMNAVEYYVKKMNAYGFKNLIMRELKSSIELSRYVRLGCFSRGGGMRKAL